MWRGTQTGVRRQLGPLSELANITDLDQDPRPEAGADPRQALDDARLGQAEKSALNLLFHELTASKDSVQLLGELGDQAGRGLSTGDDNGLRLGGNEKLVDPYLRFMDAVRSAKQRNQPLGACLPELRRTG